MLLAGGKFERRLMAPVAFQAPFTSALLRASTNTYALLSAFVNY